MAASPARDLVTPGREGRPADTQV
ncbi:MAG: hypothetical protein RLZ55_1242, partial [Actinomycetota bacterium]